MTNLKSVTIQINEKTHANIKTLAAIQNKKLSEVYDKAAQEYLRQNKELIKNNLEL